MLRVLIVDDENSSADMLQLLLQEYYPPVSVAGVAYTVATAAQFLAQQSIDLVFLDIQLKGESGFDLLDKNPTHAFRSKRSRL